MPIRSSPYLAAIRAQEMRGKQALEQIEAKREPWYERYLIAPAVKTLFGVGGNIAQKAIGEQLPGALEKRKLLVEAGKRQDVESGLRVKQDARQTEAHKLKVRQTEGALRTATEAEAIRKKATLPKEDVQRRLAELLARRDRPAERGPDVVTPEARPPARMARMGRFGPETQIAPTAKSTWKEKGYFGPQPKAKPSAEKATYPDTKEPGAMKPAVKLTEAEKKKRDDDLYIHRAALSQIQQSRTARQTETFTMATKYLNSLRGPKRKLPKYLKGFKFLRTPRGTPPGSEMSHWFSEADINKIRRGGGGRASTKGLSREDRRDIRALGQGTKDNINAAIIGGHTTWKEVLGKMRRKEPINAIIAKGKPNIGFTITGGEKGRIAGAKARAGIRIDVAEAKIKEARRKFDAQHEETKRKNKARETQIRSSSLDKKAKDAALLKLKREAAADRRHHRDRDFSLKEKTHELNDRKARGETTIKDFDIFGKPRTRVTKKVLGPPSRKTPARVTPRAKAAPRTKAPAKKATWQTKPLVVPGQSAAWHKAERAYRKQLNVHNRNPARNKAGAVKVDKAKKARDALWKKK